jgi:virginiamycin B lyase
LKELPPSPLFISKQKKEGTWMRLLNSESMNRHFARNNASGKIVFSASRFKTQFAMFLIVETELLKSLPIWLACLLVAFTSFTCHASTSTPALSGIVRSAEEGAMEGVLVSAKRIGDTITISVVSNSDGHYSFPAGRLQRGTYKISIRAAGYQLKSPSLVTVPPAGSANADLSLTKTSNLAPQLTSAEWLISVPGPETEKKTLYRCAACNDLTPIMQSRYDEKTWPEALRRMETWAPPSVITSPVRLPLVPPRQEPNIKFVQYLASINLNQRNRSPFELRTFSRPKGAATRVIITEYDLPGDLRLPHDAVVGHDGFIWYNDFQRALIGRLDPQTGQTKEWNLPILRPGFPEGLLTIKIDKDGNAWIPRFFQGCTLAKLDTKTEQFTNWTVPDNYNGPKNRCAHVALGAPDGTIWMSDSGGRKMFKFDPKTGQFHAYDSFPGYTADRSASSIETAGRMSSGHRTYGIGVDSKGNGYFADIAGGTIGEVDAQTGHVTLYPTPTPDSGPRRTFMDSQDQFWFGENYSSKIGMFDTNTKKFKEWTPPTPWSGAYPVSRDKNGAVWTVGMSTDYVYRLDPETGTFIEYLLPTLGANMRKVDVDNSTTPVTVWVAEVHKGKIAKIEPQP